MQKKYSSIQNNLQQMLSPENLLQSFHLFSQQNVNFNTIIDNVSLHREHLLQYIFISVSYILIIILNLIPYASNVYNIAPKMRIIFIKYLYLSLLIYITAKDKFNSS